MKRLYLIGGASAAGKTTRARSLARELDAGWLQADTIWRALQPILPEGSPERDALGIDEAIRQGKKSPEELVRQHVAASAVVCRALAPAIAFEMRTTYDTLVVDGSWLDPAWISALAFAQESVDGEVRGLASFDPGEPVEVRGVVIHEADADEVKRAMRMRWSAIAGPLPQTLPRQRLGAQVAWRYGNWLRDEALAHRIPVIGARPRESLRGRLRAALGLEAS